MFKVLIYQIKQIHMYTYIYIHVNLFDTQNFQYIYIYIYIYFFFFFLYMSYVVNVLIYLIWLTFVEVEFLLVYRMFIFFWNFVEGEN